MKKRLLSLLLAMVMIVTMLPVQAIAEEADETPALTEAAEAIIEEATVPVVETEAPTEETEAPAEETEAPAEETEAPTEETEAPTEETEAPTEETEAPTEETEAPTEETEALIVEAEALEEAAEGAGGSLKFLLPSAEPEGEATEITSLTLKAGESVTLTVVDASGEPVEQELMMHITEPAVSIKQNESKLLVTAEEVTKETTATVYCGTGPVLSADTADTLTVTVIPRPVITVLDPGNTEELILAPGASMGLGAQLSTSSQAGDGIVWSVKNKDGSECTVAQITTNEDDALILQAADTVETPTMVTVTVSQEIPEGYTEDTIAFPVSFDVIVGNALSLKITNLPETITMGSKSLTLKVADSEGKAYKGKLTWEMQTANPDDSQILPAVATLSSKGVLKTSMGLNEAYSIRVRAVAADLRRTEWTPVTLVPPVESFWVEVEARYGSGDTAAEEPSEGAVKRKDPIPWEFDFAGSDIYLYACDFLPSAARKEVKWDIKVSSKVATYDFLEDGTPVIHPTAPGKLTFTATATDGSGAKYSGTVLLTGEVRQLEIVDVDPTTIKGGESHTFKVKAWYDNKKTLPVPNPKVSWEYYGPEGLASINSKGVLTVSKNITSTESAVIVARCDEVATAYEFLLRPANDLTPFITCKIPEIGYWYDYSGFYAPPGTQMLISGMVFDANAEEEEAYKESAPTSVSVKGAAYDKETGILTVGNKENTKVTITATFDIDGTTKKARLWFWVGAESDHIELITKSVPSGKTTQLKAVSRYKQGDDWMDCSRQKFTWSMHDPYAALRGKVKLTKDGKLTVSKLDHEAFIGVNVTDSYGRTSTFKITLEPIKQVKPTVEFISWYKKYFNSDTNAIAVNMTYEGYEVDLDVNDYKASVLIDGKDYSDGDVTITGITSSKESIAAPVYADDVLQGFKFTGKTGSVVLTFQGEVNTGVEGAEPVPFTKAVTIKAVKAVTDVTLNGSLVGTVGKSLNLKPVVNKDATSKKLNWYIKYNSLKPDFEEWDKTTIKNGVIKFDGSFYSEERTYTVSCRSADGFYKQEWKVKAEAAANAVYIFGVDLIASSESLFNGTTQTITRGQTLSTTAGSGTPECLVIQWTMTAKSSNPKVAAVYKMNSGNWFVQGLKPGKATITFTANSGKKASFKVVVTNEASNYLEVTGLKPFQDNLITKKKVKYGISLHTTDGRVIDYSPVTADYFRVMPIIGQDNLAYFDTDIDPETGKLIISSPNYDPKAPVRRVVVGVLASAGGDPLITIIPLVTRAYTKVDSGPQ